MDVDASRTAERTGMTRLLVVNTGSSSLKWTVLATDETVLASGNDPWQSEEVGRRVRQLRATLRAIPDFDVVAHRVVHGGTIFRQAVVIDARVQGELVRLAKLDPEHMYPALAGIDAIQAEFPNTPQVAAFDTAFHAGLPEPASGYGVPFEWVERWGARRFGFHGLSVAYAVRRMRELLGEVPPRAVVCHLGSGCSLTAVKEGRSVDTSMGFSSLEGVMMSTRSGSVDPGLILYLLEHCGFTPEQLREALTRRSGLRGVSGVSADVREVLAAADRGSTRARLAYARFVLSIRRALGGMVGVLGGVDAVVFTGGIGENSSAVRCDVLEALGFTGLALGGPEAALCAGDHELSAAGSPVTVLVVRAREELAILEDFLHLRKSRPEVFP